MAPIKRRKIALMGSTSVGKSALSFQFMEGKFVEGYDPTIEHTFKKHLWLNSQEYEMVLIDTAGQDEYSMFPSQYLIDVHGFVLVYDIVNRRTFNVVSALYDRLRSITGNPHIPSILVANKLDLSEFREVSYEDGKKLADKWKATFIETSAKDNTIVKTIFAHLLEDIDRVDARSPTSGCSIS